MIKFLSKILGGGKDEDGGVAVKGATGGKEDITTFVDYVVRSLVDAPAEVKVEAEESDDSMLVKITCRKEDIGRIIGKSGKTIAAIRSLVKGAASRLDIRARVEVVE